MFTFGDGQPHESSVIVQVRARAVVVPPSADTLLSSGAKSRTHCQCPEAPEIQRKRVTHEPS